MPFVNGKQVQLTEDWAPGGYKITVSQFESTIVSGTPPLVVASNTRVPNLNADLLDGVEASSFLQNINSEAITDLSDVAAKSGSGTTVLFQGSPSLTTPTIASFANSAHNHQNAAGGEQLDHVLALSGIGIDDHHARDHAGTHAEAGADALLVENLGTAVVDTSLVLTVDGFGSVAFGAVPTIDHGGLDGLGDDDHTQYLLVAGTRGLSGTWSVGGFAITNLTGLSPNTPMVRSLGGHLNAWNNVWFTQWVNNASESIFVAPGGTSGTVVFNEGGRDLNFRAEGTGGSDLNLWFMDAGLSRVGIGTGSPHTKLTIEGTLTLKEQAAADGDTAAYGQLWVKSDTPNTLWFTDDSGADHELPLLNDAGDLIWGAGDGTGLQYANMYAHDNATVTTISTAGEANKVQITIFGVNGPNNGVTPDHINDHITVVTAGHYMAHVAITASGAGGDQDKFGFSMWKNNGATEFANVHGHRNLAGGAGDVGSIHLSGIIDLAVNDTIEVWVWNEDDTDNVTITDISLTLVQIGGT